MAIGFKTGKPETAVKSADSAAKKEAPRNLNIELLKISRYFYKGTLYEKGSVYVFDEVTARHMFSLIDPTSGLNVFGLAKPRTRLVQIPVETQTIKMKEVAQDTPIPTSVKPMGRLDLGDDDLEEQGRLERIDAETVAENAGTMDTGSPVTVS